MKKLTLELPFFLGRCLSVLALLVVAACEKDENPIAFDDEIYVSVEELKSFYNNGDVVLNEQGRFERIFINGVVTTSCPSGNLPFDQGIVIQEDRAGISLLFDDGIPTDIQQGDSVLIDVAAGTLSAENGNILVKGVAASDISVLKEGSNVAARSVAIAELNANFSDYMGALVKVVGAEVLGHQLGEAFGGDYGLDDGTGGTVQLYTRESAAFAHEALPPFGTFTGIATYGSDGTTIQVWMRGMDDYEAYIPSPYPPGFPEIFDTDLVKNAYASANLDLNSGGWTFDGVTLVTKTNARPITEDGTKGVQFNQRNEVPLYLQMNFDVYRGASKVSISYGSYGSDPGCVWRLEYSTNGGVSWDRIGDDVVTENKTAQVEEFDVDIKGQVRFRVHKLALGADDNGRLNLDDFTIYNN